MSGIIGKKIGMTRIFDDFGMNIPVTVVEAGPCLVTQVKTTEVDGYSAIQLGFEEVREKISNKPKMGHLKKAGKVLRTLKEFKNFDQESVQIGDQINVTNFKVGDVVSVTGRSKGKGFQGGVKRHGFAGGPKTHGQSDRHRAPGSIGAGSSPSRVWKGMKMPGQMGNKNVTVSNLVVVSIDPEKNLLLLKGAVPGSRNGLLRIVRNEG